MKTEYKMKEGSMKLEAVDPIICVNGTGRQAFIWVGNNSDIDKYCFATLSGEKTLEKFAVNILKALKSKHLKSPNNK